MKNIYSYKEFLNEKNELNEGLLGKLFDFFKNKIGNYAKKVKASTKIDPIIEQAKKDIDQLFDDKFKELLKKKGEELKKQQGNTEKPAQEIKQESKIYEAEDSTQVVEEKPKNPIDEAISKWLGMVKKKVDTITKDSPIAQGYAQLKMVELEELILKRKIDFYKEEMGIDNPKLFQKETENIAKKTKTFSEKLSNLFKKKEDEKPEENKYNPGDTIKYTKKDGEENEAEVAEDQTDVEDGWIKLKTDNNKTGFVVKKDKIIK